ncbi:MAG TPA: hypothetical protein VNZ63_03240 [Verrucomicrobiae bacterium]|jgi:hypothetical protein|nr:hypothetical protein [Verrucomicrobiae bacterium]
MLKGFMDRGEKFDATDRVACVVATVFKPTLYKQFVRPWERMLKRWGASAFHATDFYNGAEEFKRDTSEKKKWFDEDARQIPILIGENVTRILCVAFRPDEFVARASAEWKGNFGTDTHAIAAQLCLVINGWWLQEKKPSESFAYVQEAGDESEGKVAEAARRMRIDKGYSALIRVRSFNMVDKGVAKGLEASDFVAWHWNKHYMDRLRKGYPEPRKDFAALMNLTERQGKVQSAFITGDKLNTFFEVLERARNDKLKEKREHANAKAKGQTAQ